MVIFDTNVFIEAFKNNSKAKKLFASFSKTEIALSTVTAMELYYGAFNKQELAQIKKFLSSFHLFYLNESISIRAMNLIEEYAKSHSLDIPDSLIAATAIHNRSALCTYNVKDFHFIPNLELHKTP